MAIIIIEVMYLFQGVNLFPTTRKERWGGGGREEGRKGVREKAGKEGREEAQAERTQGRKERK